MHMNFFSRLQRSVSRNERSRLARILTSAGTALVALGLLFGLVSSVRAQTVTALTFSPSAITSGDETTLTVTLSSAAPTGGAAVAITQNGTTYGTATLAAGQSSITAPWQWFEAPSAAVHFVAKYNNSSATGILNVTYAPWTSVGVGVAGDGSSRVLAVRSDGDAGIWLFGSDGAQTAFGSTFSHATSSQGTWAATAVAAASDDTARILWARSDGALNLWSLSANGRANQIGPVYGPYSDSGASWTPRSIGVAGDGTSRVLWTRSDDAAGIWTLNATGALTQVGPTYGPYTGWTAKAIAVANDGTSRVLWARSDGAAGLWSFGTNDAQTVVGSVYGPFTSSVGNWSAKAIGVAGDGTSRVLWARSDGAAGVWSFGVNDTETVVGSVYGPFTDTNGLWTAGAVGVGSDGTSRVLWTRPNTQAGLWSFGVNDTETAIGPVYGPY